MDEAFAYVAIVAILSFVNSQLKLTALNFLVCNRCSEVRKRLTAFGRFWMSTSYIENSRTAGYGCYSTRANRGPGIQVFQRSEYRNFAQSPFAHMVCVIVS